MATEGWAVAFGTARRGLSGLWPRPVPSSLSVNAAKTAVQAFVSTRLDYCNSLMNGIADGLITGATTHRLRSGSCTGFQSANEFSSSWQC